MNIFAKVKAKMQYKHNLKKSSKQLAKCVQIYEKNERHIQKLKALIDKDKECAEENGTPS